MRIKIFVLLLLSCYGAISQNLVFSEDFDLPSGADSITAGASGTSSPTFGDTSSALFVSSGHSYRIQGSVAPSQVYFETDYFSTLGLPYVQLEFDHIAKLYLLNKGEIEISTDSAVTWIPLTGTQYRGSDVLFKALNSFNQSSYNNIASGGLWQITNHLAFPNSTWWRHEVFELTGLASDTTFSGSYQGYPAVKIRFKADFSSAILPLGNQYAAGWFIDNVKVYGATCEFNPPVINLDLDFTSTPCYLSNPQGQIPVISSNTYSIGAIVSDSLVPKSGVDMVKCFYQINSGAWQSNTLVKQSFPPFEYKTDLTNVFPGDTVKYYVSAWDNCGNNSKMPSGTGLYQFIVTHYPSKCNTSICDTLDIIKNFPWLEDFEGPEWVAGTGTGDLANNSHRGDFPDNPDGPWTVTPPTSNFYGWSIRTGPTGTADTGPIGDHTSGNGKYVYSEFSPNPSGTNNRGTTFLTPCIDLTDSTAKLFTFYYHSYGAEAGNIRIDVDTGSSAPAYWLAYSRVKGPQQYSSADPWKKAYVSLEPFVGQVIKIRFFTAATNSNTELKDLSLDDLSITEPSLKDLELISISSPVDDPCGPSSSVPVKVVLRNLGPDSLFQIPLAYQLDNGAVVRDTLSNNPLALADSITFTFGDSLSFPPAIPHVLKVWSELPGDVISSNDSLVSNIGARTGNISQFPYFLDFENSLVIPNTPGNLNDPAWTMNETSIGGQFEIIEGVLDNTTNGPLQLEGINKKGIRLKSLPGAQATYVNLRSNCFDFTNMSAPSLSFLHYMPIGKSIEIRVRVGNDNWASIATVNGNGSFKDQMTLERVSLAAYAGQSIRIEFLIDDPASGDWDDQLFLDNIIVAEAAQIDLGINREIGTLRRTNAGVTALPSFSIDLVKSMWPASPGTQLNLSFGSLCQPNAPKITGSVSFTPVFGSTQISQVVPSISLSDTLRSDLYLLKAWLNTPGDSLYFNDTIYQECIVQGSVGVPYFNDFESCNPEFLSNGKMRQWQLGTPTGGAFSGNNAYVTNLDTGLISGSAEEKLIPPFFTGLDTVIGAEMWFRHRFNFQGPNDRNFGKVQYLEQGVWKDLTNPAFPGYNWLSVMSFSASHGYVFHGNSGSNWIWSGYPLDPSKQPSLNIYRLVTTSQDSGTSNWEVDDFQIVVPEQNSASPRQLIYDQGIPDTTNAISLRIFNSGRRQLNDFEVVILDQNGNTLIQEQAFAGFLAYNQSTEVSLQNALVLNPSITELTIITSRPNNRVDQRPGDDTLRVPVKILSTTDTLPYCTDFELDEEFLAFTNGSADALWKHEAPSKTILDSAYSGTNVWITGSTGDYPALSDNYLYTSRFYLDELRCYSLSFWHWYETEYNFDGGNVEFSLDDGTTWQVFGSTQDSTWYNTPYVQSLDAVKPGFTGSSNGWTRAFKEFKVFGDSYIQFRFRFASTATTHNEGWMIDDLCLEQIQGWCYQVGEEEIPLENSSLKLFPNPASNVLNFEINNITSDRRFRAQIVNSVGIVVVETLLEIKPDGAYSLDISQLPLGSYILHLNNEQRDLSQIFIKE